MSKSHDDAAPSSLFLTPARLALLTGGRWAVEPSNGVLFTHIGYQSGGLYFPLDLKKQQLSDEAFRRKLTKRVAQGATALVVDRASLVEGWLLPVLLVDNLISAFESAAKGVRALLNPFTILITGTEGKTGAKLQLHHLLSQQTSTHAVLDSNNTIFPILRSLMNLSCDDRIEINEVSIGSDEVVNQQQSLAVNADLCLFTHLGPNYMDIHHDMDTLIDRKSSVVEGMRSGGCCLIDGDNAYADQLQACIEARRADVRVVRYGSQAQHDAQLLSQVFDDASLGWRVTARIDDVVLSYDVPMLQQHFPLSTVAVMLAIKLAGYDIAAAAEAYQSLKPYRTMGMVDRLSLPSGGEVLFYDQSSRGAISGMRSAFADLRRLPHHGKLVALIGGVSVLNDSDWTMDVHRQLAELVNESPIDCLYTTGSYMHYMHEHLTKTLVGHHDDRQQLIAWLLGALQAGDKLFIIGSAYLELNVVASEIRSLLLSGKTNADVALHDYPYLYRLLQTYDHVSRTGEYARYSCLHYGLSFETFKALQQSFPDIIKLRGELLNGFFDRLPLLFEGVDQVKLVNEQIVASGYAGRVYTRDYCQRWFNHADENAEIDSKSVFGSFFDVGSEHWLLSFTVASSHLHVGLVPFYRDISGSLNLVRLSESESLARLSHEEDRVFDRLTYRHWARGWLSMDIGKALYPMEWEQFALLTRFEQTIVFQQHVLPWLTDLIALMMVGEHGSSS